MSYNQSHRLKYVIILAAAFLGMITPLMAGVSEILAREKLQKRCDTDTRILFLGNIRKTGFESQKIMNFFKELANDFPTIDDNLTYYIEYIEGIKYKKYEERGIINFSNALRHAENREIDSRVRQFYEEIIKDINRQSA